MHPGKTVFVCKVLIEVRVLMRGLADSKSGSGSLQRQFVLRLLKVIYEHFFNNGITTNNTSSHATSPHFTFAQHFVFLPLTFILHHLLVKRIFINCKNCFHFFIFRNLLSHSFPLSYIDTISAEAFHNFPLSLPNFLGKFLHLYTIDEKLNKKFHDFGRIFENLSPHKT